MKKLIGLLLMLTCMKVFSQDSLSNFNNARNRITITGMKVLSGWGIANLGVGAVGWAASGQTSGKYFYQMSTLWGAVNAGIGLLGLTGAKRNLSKQPDQAGSLKAQQVIEKTFLINGGIDFIYIGTGIYLNTRGNSRNDIKLKGYGSSIIMQGAFLLLFDATMYKLQRTNGNRMRNFLAKNSVTFSGNRFGVTHMF